MMSPAERIEKDERRLAEHLYAGLAEAGVTSNSLLLAAISGGADSVAMLELLSVGSKTDRPDVTVAYVDHGIDRSRHLQESAQVQAQARRHGFPFAHLSVNNDGGDDEASLRALRYQALESHAASTGATAIATAHTREDQVETIVGRLMRGAGRRGLAGIDNARGLWVRPLLECGRQQLRDYLLLRGLGWCEDPSNADLRYTRNRIRAQLLPSLHQEIGDSGFARLVRSARRLREEDHFLDAEARRHLGFVQRGAWLDVCALDRVPLALRPRLLRTWLDGQGCSAVLELDHIEALEALASKESGNAQVDLPGIQVRREYNRLTIADAGDQNAHSTADGLTNLQLDKALRRLPCLLHGPSQGWQLTIDQAGSDAPADHSGPYFEEVDIPARLLGAEALLRTALPGDRVERSGGSRKIQDLLVDARVPVRLRRIWPVLTSGRRIVWVPGLARVAAAGKADEQTAALRMCWRMKLR